MGARCWRSTRWYRLPKQTSRKPVAYYWSAKVYEAREEIENAAEQWTLLLELPESAMTEEMRAEAEERLSKLATATPTITPSPTRTPTKKVTPTRTPIPSKTPIPTKTSNSLEDSDSYEDANCFSYGDDDADTDQNTHPYSNSVNQKAAEKSAAFVYFFPYFARSSGQGHNARR